MKGFPWILIGGLAAVVLISMRSRAGIDMPPEAFPAPPVTNGGAPMPVTVITPEGETWEATMDGTYFVVR